MAFALPLDLAHAISWLRGSLCLPSNVVQDVLPKATLLQTPCPVQEMQAEKPSAVPHV